MEDKKKELSEQEILMNLPFLASSESKPFDFGVMVGDEFLYWDERFDKGSRAVRKMDRIVNNIINFIVGLVTGVLFALAGVSIFVLLPEETWNRIEFWIEPSFGMLWFWLAMFSALFLIYRRALAKREPVETGDRESHDVSVSYISWDGVGALTRDKKVSIADRSISETIKGLESAAELAEAFSHANISLLHIFAGQLSQPSVGHVFARLGISFDSIKDALASKMRELPTTDGLIAQKFDPLAQKVILGAAVHARLYGRTVVMPVDMFISAYRNSEFLRELFYNVGVEGDQMENVLGWLQIREKLRARWQSFRKASAFKPVGPMNRAYTSVATPLLDSISTDLTAGAVRGGLPMLIGRKEEMDRILRVFESGGRSCVIVGQPGVGKRTMIDGIAELMVKEDVPEMLQDKRLVSLDIARLISGATPAQAQERLLQALYDVGRSSNIAIAIANIHEIVGVGSSGDGLDLSAVLAQELEKGYFVMIATTTPDAYRASIEGKSLGNILTKVVLDEPKRDEAILILESKVGVVEARDRVVFSYAAVEAIVEMTAKYVHDQFLPEKSIRVLDEVGLAVKQKRGVGATVLKEDVAEVVSTISNIPLTAVTQDEKSKLLELEVEMKQRVIGQDAAVEMVASALRRARMDLRSGRRPIANFLFMGPTGVGKTELAKTIADVYFGDQDAMIRLDMSEYQDKSSVDRMLGVAGSDEGGVFTEAVRARPFGLILLDELEKAHPDILNLFLQVFDDGRLTDASGRTVDFTQTIIVATSNAGSSYIQAEVKKGTDIDFIKNHLIEVDLAGVYRPEFLNRFDGVVVFKPLSLESVVSIARLMIVGVAVRLEDKGIGFEVTDAAYQELAVAGYDPQFGARPLRRVIQEKVEDKLATLLLKDEVVRGDVVVLGAGGIMNVKKGSKI